MIYDNLNLAKEDLKWLLGVNTIISDSTNALNSKKVEMILENLTSFDVKYLELFYTELFNSLDFQSLSFSKDISKQYLPNFAIVPNFGVAFIYEQNKEGEYKAQTKDGIKIFKSFPANTRFANLRKKEVSKEKTSAYEMFKKVALEQKRLLVYAAAATFSINTLALGTSLYTMQVYDRVVPTGAISTLVALTIGVFIAIFLEMMIKFSRSVLLDSSFSMAFKTTSLLGSISNGLIT